MKVALSYGEGEDIRARSDPFIPRSPGHPHIPFWARNGEPDEARGARKGSSRSKSVAVLCPPSLQLKFTVTFRKS